MLSHIFRTVAATKIFLMHMSTSATTITLTPSADGDVFNNGITPPVIDTTDTVVSTYSSGIAQRDAIFEFDLSSIPDTAPILGASISFFLFAGGLDSTMHAIDYPGDGVIDLSDHNHAGTTAASLTVPRVTSSQTFSFNYTDVSGIAGALAGDLYTLRFDVYGTSTFRLASLEHTTYDPLTLTIEYRSQQQAVPTPTTLSLLLAGVIGAWSRHWIQPGWGRGQRQGIS
ncbi:MAG: hypothetical protein D6786_03515 [Gammaproteobacteria bacterium]|nr:MAG: hypothetical protein D6786_03515 [Gammaproteobacteria bacterium]